MAYEEKIAEIKTFLTARDLYDEDLDKYTPEVIESIIKIINGQVHNHYSDEILCSYAASYYSDNHDLHEKYLKMAIHIGGKYLKDHLECLADLYRDQSKLELAEEYYLKAVENGSSTSLCKLGDLYYKNLQKESLGISYYIKSIEAGLLLRGLEALNKIFRNNKLKIYYTLLNADQNNEHISVIMNILRTQYKIICYENKKKLSSKRGECPICLEDDIQTIPKECVYHYFCYHCYIEISKCPICTNYK